MALTLRKDTKTNPEKPVIFVFSNNDDPRVASNETYVTKDILKKYKASFDGKTKRWQWTVHNNKYFDYILGLAKNAVDEANEFLDFKDQKIAGLINTLNDIEEGLSKPSEVSGSDKEAVLEELRSFIRDLQDEVDASRFNEKIQNYLIFISSVRGYSPGNIFLIYIQNPEAKDVRSKTAWAQVGMKPKPDAKGIVLLRPPLRPYSESEKKEIEKDFREKNGYGPNEPIKDPIRKAKLEALLKRGVPSTNDFYKFIAYYTYDVTDVESIDGSGAEKPNVDDIEWYNKSDKGNYATELAKTMIKVMQKAGIKVAQIQDLGGARGVSTSGAVNLLSDDAGVSLFKTATHEFAHEILHQNFLKVNDKDKQSVKDKEFVDLYIGKASPKKIIELQAEAVAYVVARKYGMNPKESANYIALFDNDRKHIEQNLEIITKCSNKIISLFEEEKQSEVNENSSVKLVSKDEVADLLGVERVLSEMFLRKKIRVILKNK